MALVGLVVLIGAVVWGGGDSSRTTGRAAGGNDGPLAQQAVPAYDSGGACQLLDYGMIYQALGLNFSIAASSRAGGHLHLLVLVGVAFPDLSLSVTSTKADDKVFKDAT